MCLSNLIIVRDPAPPCAIFIQGVEISIVKIFGIIRPYFPYFRCIYRAFICLTRFRCYYFSCLCPNQFKYASNALLLRTMFCFYKLNVNFSFSVVNNVREPIRVDVGEARDHCFSHVYFIKKRYVVSLM